MALNPIDFQFVSTLVRQRSAIVLEPEKSYLLEARLTPLARAEGFASLEALVAQMRAQPFNGLHRKVVEAMTTNETSFFRDLHPFAALRQVVIPEVLKHRQATRTLNIWCAACSSGQEPYTVAMTLLEHFPQLTGWNFRILATDLSGEMVTRSRAGRYGQIEVNRGLPANLLVKWFEKKGMEWQVKPEVQRYCEFREMNLIEPWGPLPAMDVVFLRNVLIYFDVETKRQILGNVRKVLQSWGYLFLGGAETTINLGDTFERVQFDKAGCYRIKGS
ncbi:MAG: protein-glutamate O-methyltransferase CheR [Gemmatimonadetes bacterium]|nr:protein-glutamate O-methyltransferase CheR [Gemmatimonadota bacterium]MBP9200674.1 protein-glutamate O-methyltransferase CheR [Gemmatimonadales bacterium]MBK6778325.1 protein-glutamate O-methyltransferase CheR [Gemmatimonadota bacterium]MBK7349365.1 protein-glutamate O-methyltransferase CheR [Gemmatimonadota bacterium]MBK7714933.1 protein-glutamate O-methyltransferase CheR [Gemmatimonadota bacterium]